MARQTFKSGLEGFFQSQGRVCRSLPVAGHPFKTDNFCSLSFGLLLEDLPGRTLSELSLLSLL